MTAAGIITPDDLMLGALAEIVALIDTTETGPNSGPVVNLILASVRLPPGKSWCAATAFYAYQRAAMKLSTVNPIPRTGGCLRMWELADGVWHTQVPRPGVIYVLDHGQGLGHVGVVEAVEGLKVKSEVSGNTFKDGGGRNGNTVARHFGPPEITHKGRLVGYIDVGRAAPAPLVA